MNQSTLRSFYRPYDNIHIFTVADSSVATVQDWSQKILSRLDQSVGPHKHLYDLRDLRDLSIYAIRAAIKFKGHPRSKNVYSAVLTTHPQAIDKINLILKIQPGGHFRLFNNQQEAINWLNTQVPIVDDVTHFFETAYLNRQEGQRLKH